MTVSRFPHGIFATPNIGGSRLVDVWNSENIFFVDGDNGSASNSGKDPANDAHALPSTAVDAALRSASIYIRPKATAASAQSYYVDNITLPLTKPGISLMGAGSNDTRPFMGVAIKASVVTSPVVTVKGTDCHIENMRLAGTGQTAGYAIVYAHASTTSNGPVGLQIRNCRLDNAKTGGAISIDSPNHMEVVGCSFDECAIGITSILSYGGVASRGLKIMDCDFGGRIATRTVDIYLSQSGAGTGAGVAGYEIRDCRFLDLGTLAGAYSPRNIYVVNGDIGLISNCDFSSAVAGTFGATGDQCIFPTSWHIVNCHHEGVVANPHLGLIGIT